VSAVVAALPFANRRGRIDTNRMLQVEMKAGIWALGDCASIPDGNGALHPPTAQHALRQARTAASNIVASIRGEALRPFSFKTIGQLAAIGHRTGVGRIFGRRFSGFIAWWMWRTIYLSKLPGLASVFVWPWIGLSISSLQKIRSSTRPFAHSHKPLSRRHSMMPRNSRRITVSWIRQHPVGSVQAGPQSGKQSPSKIILKVCINLDIITS
jgi:hypothetical protein